MSARIALLLLFCPCLAHASQKDEAVTFEAGPLRMALNSAGHVVSLFDAVRAKDYAAPGGSGPLLSIGMGDRVEQPTAATYDQTRRQLTLNYGTTGITAVVEVSVKPTHVTFELKTLSITPEQITWGPLATTIGETIGETIGVVRDADFALGIQALNIKTVGGAEGVDSGSRLYAKCRDYTQPIPARKPGRCDTPPLAGPDATVVGSKIALFGCRADRALEIIGQIELAEGLPHPMLDGVWAKISPEATRSYIICPFNEASLDKLLAVARQAGLKYIYHENPFKSWGHFELNPDDFPDGDAGMRRCVERAAKAGIRVGLHTLSNFIQPHDPYVRGLPDPRLLRLGVTKLAADIDERATEIPVEDPAVFRQKQWLFTAVVGQELIRFESVSDSAPFRLLGCRRGSFGTTSARHTSGSEIGNLADHEYKTFFPNIEMQDEMALRLAELFSNTGLRQISFDGLEGCQATGYGAYAEARFVKIAYDGWQQEVINDSSQLKHYTWHMHTRMNWGEPWGKAMREGMTEYRFKNQDYFRRNLLPPMLGWFQIRSSTPDLEATSLDEVEWVLAKSAGFGAGCAWHTSLFALDRLGNKNAILAAIREWDLARHSGAFTEAQRARLRDVRSEFHLEKVSEGNWQLVPVAFSPPFVHGASDQDGKAPAQAAWSVTNSFARQPLQFTLRVAPLEAQVQDAFVKNPSFEIGGHRFTIPVQLKPNQYLVCEGDEKGLVYDSNWHLIETVQLAQPMPVLSEGTQQVQFRCEFAGAPNARMEVRFKMVGPMEPVK